MKIYCIDYGHKKCGVAYADLSVKPWISFPFDVISTEDIYDFVDKLLIDNKNILIVLGKSIDRNGNPNKIQHDIDNFKEELKKRGIKVVLFDERYTSSSANSFKRFLKKKDKRYKKIDKNIDSYAASVILQNFLDYIKNTNKKML